MTFLGGFFLLALPLAAVPVIIHLLHRRRRRIVQWGAMQLLMDSVARKRRLFRLDDAILMAVRAACVAAIVLAFARPQLRSGILTGKPPGQDVIMILDTTLSTGRRHGNATVFDQIKRKATEIVQQLGPSDQIRLMVAASNPVWIGDRDKTGGYMEKERAAQQIAELKPTEAAADFPLCVQSALSAEPPADATRRLIVIVTDGIAYGWNADIVSRWQPILNFESRATLPTAINVVTADVPASSIMNLAVEKLTTNRTRVAVGEPFSVTARLQNAGEVRSQAATLKWDIDGQTIGESAIDALDPGQSLEVALETSLDRAGAFALSSRLAREDDLPGDNAASVVFEALERLPILICRAEADRERPKSQPDFLMAALGRVPEASHGDFATAVFEPTIVGIDALGGTDLSAYRCVIFDDVVPKTVDSRNNLADFAANGGGIWLLAGENCTADEFNAVVFRDGSGLAPVSLGQRVKADAKSDFFTIHPPERTHPATALLADTERLDIDDVRITEYWQLAAPAATEDISILLATGEGAPLAVEYFNGDGRIIVQATPNDAKWTNLPVCQAFVPLVQEWLWYLTQPSAINYNLDPGAAIVLSSAMLHEAKEARVLNAIGQTARIPASSSDDKRLKFRDTLFPGNYQVTVSPKQGESFTIPYSVRRDARESRMVPLSMQEIANLEQQGGLRFRVDPLSLPNATVRPVQFVPFWNYLLGLSVLLFLAELACTYLLGRRRAAQTLQPVNLILSNQSEPPGLRGRSI